MSHSHPTTASLLCIAEYTCARLQKVQRARRQEQGQAHWQGLVEADRQAGSGDLVGLVLLESIEDPCSMAT